jgi:putative nucleotidyltransferase with HDIG domain
MANEVRTPTPKAVHTRRRLSGIPAFPPVTLKLLSLLSNDDVDIGKIAELVSGDPVFCARILGRANSAEFALQSTVRDLRQAIVILGLNRTWQETLSAATAAYTRAALGTTELRRCWRHTIACAVLSEKIAQACEIDPANAYSAGLLHDIGRLGLLVAYPAEYEAVIRNAAEKTCDLLDFERERFGVDHAEAGRWLAVKWRLPEVYQVIAGRHHDRPDGAPTDLLTIVHVACRLADFLGFEVTQPLLAMDFDQIAADLPKLARERIKTSSQDIAAEIERTIASYENSDRTPPAIPDEAVEEDEDMLHAEILLPDGPAAEQQSTGVWRNRALAVLIFATVVSAIALYFK